MTKDPILEGFIAGLVGIMVGYFIDALILTISTLNIPWYLWFVFIIVIVVDFFIGIAEIINGGVFFAAGIIIVGLLLADFWTIINGLIAILGFILGVIVKWQSQ